MIKLLAVISFFIMLWLMYLLHKTLKKANIGEDTVIKINMIFTALGFIASLFISWALFF